MLYVRFPLSLRNVEDLLHERGIKDSHETVRFWWNRFGPMFASQIRRKRIDRMRAFSTWRWHLDEVFVKINGEQHYLWRAVDHEGEVLEAIVTDRLQSYRAALKELGAEDLQSSGRWLNNRVEISHQSLRRRERAMIRFRRMRSLQTFAAVHFSVSNHFNQEVNLSSRTIVKLNRAAALEDWRQLCAV